MLCYAMPDFHSYSSSILSSEHFSALSTMIFVQCDLFLAVCIYLFYVFDIYDCVFSPPHYFMFVTVLSYFYELYFVWDNIVGVVIRHKLGDNNGLICGRKLLSTSKPPYQLWSPLCLLRCHWVLVPVALSPQFQWPGQKAGHSPSWPR